MDFRSLRKTLDAFPGANMESGTLHLYVGSEALDAIKKRAIPLLVINTKTFGEMPLFGVPISVSPFLGKRWVLMRGKDIVDGGEL